MGKHVSWHRNLFGCSTTMSSTKLSFSDRNSVASFKFTSDTTTMLDNKSIRYYQVLINIVSVLQHHQTYRSTKESLATGYFCAAWSLAFLASSVLDTKVSRRLGRLVASLDFTTFPSAMACAKLTPSDCTLCASLNLTALSTTVSIYLTPIQYD